MNPERLHNDETGTTPCPGLVVGNVGIGWHVALSEVGRVCWHNDPVAELDISDVNGIKGRERFGAQCFDRHQDRSLCSLACARTAEGCIRRKCEWASMAVSSRIHSGQYDLQDALRGQ